MRMPRPLPQGCRAARRLSEGGSDGEEHPKYGPGRPRQRQPRVVRAPLWFAGHPYMSGLRSLPVRDKRRDVLCS